MFKEISFCTFLEYYSITIRSKFHSILPTNGQENGTDTLLLAKKKCIIGLLIREKAFEVLLFLYKQCKHHTQKCVFCI